MRSSFPCVLAVFTALVCVPSGAATADSSLASCRWEPLARFIDLVPRDLVAAPDGTVLLAADDFRDPLRPSVRVLRGSTAGDDWQEVDHFFPDGAYGTGARALHVDADGNTFLLAWVQTSADTELVLRRSFAGGAAGTWETAEQRWQSAVGGALTSDPDGRLYVAYGFAGSEGIGWRVVSALRGIGAFRGEDEFRPAGGTVYGAVPQAIERAPNGALVVAGQLDGNPDEWVLRQRRLRPNGRPGLWHTIDRYKLSATSYGLLPRAVVPLAGNQLVAVGAGTPGGDSHDYRWLQRRQQGKRWVTQSYQVAAGRHSEGHDAVAGGAGVVAVGIGQTAAGNRLVLRESSDGGRTWQTAVELAGVDRSIARLAARGAALWVTAMIEGATVVIGCER
jgi:hypothetical protein